ncbi:uncharacterized protein BDZ99DRAFT_575142 [Mytilinidion resinicola]|uniref:Uncharacterized protein n=1 Tax=Mytilinidion resinicola TaxID=574789 RepID=A0A6A6Y805_9PEZI|nr:uncharacterized protein BDZ99DRAFT_575142 [Mytilinidion resinicola]KAF2804966.1 hypothetical protein BDZ99DRAFT_575142 [Mytilinidion resinicola]
MAMAPAQSMSCAIHRTTPTRPLAPGGSYLDTETEEARWTGFREWAFDWIGAVGELRSRCCGGSMLLICTAQSLRPARSRGSSRKSRGIGADGNRIKHSCSETSSSTIQLSVINTISYDTVDAKPPMRDLENQLESHKINRQVCEDNVLAIRLWAPAPGHRCLNGASEEEIARVP